MTAITMTSVGYGDISPESPIGKIIGILCAIWGVFIVAVMVGVITNILSLNSKESQSLTIMRKLERQN